MKTFLRETEAGFDQFSPTWQSELAHVTERLGKYRDKYLLSYRRITSLQAWRTCFLETQISKESLSFFLEAQNDALTSHVLARLGSWRLALKSLRSMLENALFTLFYMDHPVELKLWSQHKHRFLFSEAVSYFRSHPNLTGLADSVTGLQVIQKEYSTLSAAVHGSAKSFRMTESSGSPVLWNAQPASLNSWLTREGRVLGATNLLLLALFREDLQGARLPNLRKSVSLAVPVRKHTDVRTQLGVRLFRH